MGLLHAEVVPPIAELAHIQLPQEMMLTITNPASEIPSRLDS